MRGVAVPTSTGAKNMGRPRPCVKRKRGGLVTCRLCPPAGSRPANRGSFRLPFRRSFRVSFRRSLWAARPGRHGGGEVGHLQQIKAPKGATAGRVPAPGLPLTPERPPWSKAAGRAPSGYGRARSECHRLGIPRPARLGHSERSEEWLGMHPCRAAHEMTLRVGNRWLWVAGFGPETWYMGGRTVP